MLEQFGHKMAEKKTRIYRGSMGKHVTGVVLFKNTLNVPNSRFLKVRAIKTAIQIENLTSKKVQLARKLAGLLGGIASLDKRYSGLAKSSYDSLKNVQAELEMAQSMGSDFID